MIATSTLLINNIQTMEVYEMLVLNEQDQQNLLDMKEVIEEVMHHWVGHKYRQYVASLS